jgi:hypothetical protein
MNRLRQGLVLVVFGVLLPAGTYLWVSGGGFGGDPFEGLPADSIQALIAAQEARALLPRGELKVVVVVGQECTASQLRTLKRDIRKIRGLIQPQAGDTMDVRLVGVAVAWDAEAGARMLGALAEFDEIVSGGNWLNTATETLFWDTSHATPPAVPQVVVLGRTIRRGRQTIEVNGERRVGEFVGAEEIERWVNAGAPLPAPRLTHPG